MKTWCLFLLFAGLSFGVHAERHAVEDLESGAKTNPSFRSAEVAPERLIQLRKLDAKRSNTELLARIRNLEQVCVMNSPKEQMKQVQRIDERLLDLRKILEVRGAQLDFKSSEAPEDFLESASPKWSQSEIWQTRFAAQSPARKCEFIELLAGITITRLSTLAPSKAICRFQDFMCDDPTDELFQRDTKRLKWELRHFSDLQIADLPEKPAGCRVTLTEMHERAKYAEPSPLGTSRWPLGRAIGMCARPMSAHYLDDDYSKGKIPEPSAWKFQSKVGWDEILDIEENIPKN